MEFKEISVLNHRLSRNCIVLTFHAHWRRISDSFVACNYFRIAFIVVNIELCTTLCLVFHHAWRKIEPMQ